MDRTMMRVQVNSANAEFLLRNCEELLLGCSKSSFLFFLFFFFFFIFEENYYFDPYFYHHWTSKQGVLRCIVLRIPLQLKLKKLER